MKIRPIDPSRARTRKLAALSRMVGRDQFARPVKSGATVREFLDSLPDALAARDLLALARRIANARRGGRMMLLMMGAHPIKLGLGPIIRDLIADGVVTAIAANGAAAIHDFELALAGRTSEDVGAGLDSGSFGMVEETGAFMAEAATMAADKGVGFGEVIGREIASRRLKFRDCSVFAAAHDAGIPATIHVLIGADIVHMHPAADGAAIGAATMADFRRFTAVVAELSRGVALNLGSAVAMPEVFLKALNLARNLGRKVEGFMTADMDFVRNYRPRMNVVDRPTRAGGAGMMLTGHHELMLPLLAAAVREEMARRPRTE